MDGQQPGSPDLSAADIERVFASHYERVHGMVLGLVHDPAEAADLTQETFVKAFRALRYFRGEASLNPWLARIAQNTVLDHYRSATPRRMRDSCRSEASELESMPDEMALAPDQASGQQASGACVQACVDTLSGDYRQAVALHDMLELTNPEIAELLGVSLATVKIRVHRGRRQLRATFESHCEVYADERNELACRPKKAKGDA